MNNCSTHKREGKMKPMVRQLAIGATVTAFILFIASTIWIIGYLSPPTDPTLRLEYLKFTLEVYKAIGLGFLITLLGVAIPSILPEARYVFETSREARMAYSKAKTGLIYLPYELADLKFSDALAHIKNLHFEKHMAEAYPQIPEDIKWLKEVAYHGIMAAHQKLSTQTDWDSISRNDRLKILLTKDESESHK
jgi:hypothetical protein